MKQLRVLLDTNIYGLIAIDPNVQRIKDAVIYEKKVLVYGNQIIRKELRSTPKKAVFEGHSLRQDLLLAYDSIVQKHAIELTKDIEDLAEDYHLAYKKFGGNVGKNKIMNDFLIVASASIKNLDIVCSEDNRTLRGEKAMKSYRLVNEIKKINLPRFYGYGEFKAFLFK